MRHIIWVVILIYCLTGCTVEQKQPMGANADRTQGFSGYGTEKAKAWEGPLMDMMVPDASPKGLADASKYVLNDPNYLIDERNLNMRHQGINRQGERITNHKVGISRDKQVRSDGTYLRPIKGQQIQSEASLTAAIEQRVKALEKVHDAHVINDGQTIVIGIESSEGEREKLHRSVKHEISNIVDINHVRITTNRQLIDRMKGLEHNINTGQRHFGGSIAEIIDALEEQRR